MYSIWQLKLVTGFSWSDFKVFKGHDSKNHGLINYQKISIALGKAKHVTSEGVEDTKNGAMLSSYVAAESLEEAADIFKDHPHLELPGATIEVMETRQM